MKIPDEKKYLTFFSIGKKYKQTSSLLLLATVGLKFSSSNFSPTFTAILGALAIQSSIISGYDLV